MLEITLPFPPSVNTYWRQFKGRSILSAKAREYRAEVLHIVAVAGVTPFAPTDRLEITIAVSAPDNRRRDLDNMLKAPLDALQHAGVYADDNQIDYLTIGRAGILKPNGALFVIVKKYYEK